MFTKLIITSMLMGLLSAQTTTHDLEREENYEEDVLDTSDYNEADYEDYEDYVPEDHLEDDSGDYKEDNFDTLNKTMIEESGPQSISNYVTTNKTMIEESEESGYRPRPDQRCGKYYRINGRPGHCDRFSGAPCCSRWHWCGGSRGHCFCKGCKDWRTATEYPYPVILDKNMVFISNKKYPHARLAQWGKGGRQIGTYELDVYTDQLWTLDASKKHSGYFYIKNVRFKGYRIAKWGRGRKQVGVYRGHYWNDQLWKFEHVGGGFYRIKNKSYPGAKMTKFGKSDGNWGTYTGPAVYDDQHWKVTPRFESSGLLWDTIWQIDNRQGSMPVTKEITITTGLKTTSSKSFSTKIGLKTSLETSIGHGPFSASLANELTYELGYSMSTTVEKSWEKKVKIQFVAPARKNYRILQKKVLFTSPLARDNCQLRTNYKIEESSESFKTQ